MRHGVVAIALLVASPVVARAEPTSVQRANADDLFRRGNELMLKGQLAEACPLLAESERLEPAGGTLQNLAVCYESTKAWASAYATFDELRAVSKAASPPRTDRIKLAEDHIASIAPRVSRVLVTVADARTRVKIDDHVYGDAALRAGVIVDPGAHVVEASEEGKRSVTRRVIASEEGRTTRITIPALEIAASPSSKPRPRRVHAPEIVLGSVGAASVVAGGIVGILALRARSSGNDRCGRSTNPGAPATDFDASGRCYEGSGALRDANAEKSDARGLGTASTVLLPLGIVALGAAAVLYFTRGGARTPDAARIPSLLEGTF